VSCDQFGGTCDVTSGFRCVQLDDVTLGVQCVCSLGDDRCSPSTAASAAGAPATGDVTDDVIDDVNDDDSDADDADGGQSRWLLTRGHTDRLIGE